MRLELIHKRSLSPWPRPSRPRRSGGPALRAAALIALGLGACAPLARAQAVQLGVDPLRMAYHLAPGGSLTDAAHVSNLGTLPVPMTARISDWSLSPRGTPIFPMRGDAAAGAGCAAWLHINPAEFVVGPGQTETIRYTIQVPAGTPAQGCNTSILFTSAPLRRPGSQSQIFTRVRMASILYITVGHPRVAGRLADISLAPPASAGHPWQLRLLIANTGTTFFRASGATELVSAGGQTVASFPIGSQVVLPATTRLLRFPLKSAPGPGAYQLRARVEMGLPAIQQIEKNVVIGPVATGKAAAAASAASPEGPPHGATQ